MFCEEADRVAFHTTFKLPLTGYMTTVQIDQMFLDVCEPDSIMVSGLVPNRPFVMGAEINGDTLAVWCNGAAATTAVVTLYGIRRGFADVRYTPATEEEFNTNAEFWRSHQ